jgi:hypothetical protein
VKPKSLLDPLTFDQLCDLPRDNDAVGDFWFIRDGDCIHIHEQKQGEQSRQKIRIPVAVMRRLVALMTRKRKPRAKKRT